MASHGVAGKLGSLQPRIDLVATTRNSVAGVAWIAETSTGVNSSVVDEGPEREHSIREERVPKCFVRDESSDQNLDAAMCHAARLSRPSGGNRNATTGA